jgi:hypothetical protein
MQETGGSGGSGLTRNQAGAVAADPGETEPSRDGGEAEASGTAATSAARGAQDTRGRQAGRSDTGLGTPETGANQTPADMPPKTK